MKRYIRTTEKVLDTTALKDLRSLDSKFVIVDGMLIIFDKRNLKLIANHGKVLKQANNLRDLCDEVVLNNQLVQHPLNWKYIVALKKKYPQHQIYGAVWSGEGLKYVAWMDETGEMKLLYIEE